MTKTGGTMALEQQMSLDDLIKLDKTKNKAKHIKIKKFKYHKGVSGRFLHKSNGIKKSNSMLYNKIRNNRRHTGRFAGQRQPY